MKKKPLRSALLPGIALLVLLVLLSWKNMTGTNTSPSFRDLNKNGKMDVYEDPSQPVEARVKDLLSQMTLEEKAGMLFINGARIPEDGSLSDFTGTGMFARIPIATQLMDGKKMNHINLWQVPGTKALATWYNNVQKHAEQTRLGIPVTIASDPRNAFSAQIFSMAANGFSLWCEPLGLAAIGDDAFTQKFADMIRQEYVAVGIREPVWSSPRKR